MARTRLAEALRYRREVAEKLRAGEEVHGRVIRAMKTLPGGYAKLIEMVGSPVNERRLTDEYGTRIARDERRNEPTVRTLRDAARELLIAQGWVAPQ